MKTYKCPNHHRCFWCPRNLLHRCGHRARLLLKTVASLVYRTIERFTAPYFVFITHWGYLRPADRAELVGRAAVVFLIVTGLSVEYAPQLYKLFALFFA